MEYLPPKTYVQFEVLLAGLSEEEKVRMKEYCMIRFPEILYASICTEAAMDGISFEQWVRMILRREVCKRNAEREPL